jgi:hypothetical protein
MTYKENKQILLALFILMIMMSTAMFTFAQTTINPDTVCANAVGEQYFVTNTPTSTYNWTITGGGILQTGQTTNSITVDWGGVMGLWVNAVEVIESNAAGCPGLPILLDVFVLNLSSNPIGPFCPGDPSAGLTGTPVGGVWSGTGVTGNNFNPSIGIGTYALTYTLAGCTTAINVIVNGGPVTGPIQHF